MQGAAFECKTSGVKKRACKEYRPSLETILELKEQRKKPSNTIEWQGNKINNNANKSKMPYATVPLVDDNCQLKVPIT